MTETQQLLAEYVETGSEAAFRELTMRYLNLVYSTAFRLAGGDAQLAQDVAQTVFIQLAQNAGKLSRESALGGWLHRTTCNVASKVLRTERRRLARETQAMLMNAQSHEAEARMESVAPILDEAINQLGEEDRAAILLRFFEQQDFRAVGLALGSGEDAARMRVNRALEKLQGMLKRKGVAFSAAALGTMLTTSAVSAAPAGLSASIAGAVLTATTISGGMSLGFLQFMSQTKAIVTGAVLVTGLAGMLIWQRQILEQAESQNASLRRQAVNLQEEMESWKKRLQPKVAASTLNDQERVELLRLRGEMGLMRSQLASAQTEVDRLKRTARQQIEDQKTVADGVARDEAKAAVSINAAKRWGLAFNIYAGENDDHFPNSFEEVATVAREVADLSTTNRFEMFPINVKFSELENPAKTIVLKGGLFQTSVGIWKMAYTTADGAAHLLSSDTPDFSEHEKRLNLVYPLAQKKGQQ